MESFAEWKRAENNKNQTREQQSLEITPMSWRGKSTCGFVALAWCHQTSQKAAHATLSAYRNNAKLHWLAGEWPPTPREFLCPMWNPAGNDGCMQTHWKAQTCCWLHLGGMGQCWWQRSQCNAVSLVSPPGAPVVCKEHWRDETPTRPLNRAGKGGVQMEERGIWNKETCPI